MRFALVSAAVVGIVCLFASSGLALTVKLTVAERAGFDRVDEPVTFGVPLPLGAVWDVQVLRLTDEAGKPIPASFRAAQVWQRTQERGKLFNSVRWVHVSCLLSVPAKGSKTIVLTDSAPPGEPEPEIPQRGQAAVPFPQRGPGRGDLKDSPLKVLPGTTTQPAVEVTTGPVRLLLNPTLPGVIESATFGDKQVISSPLPQGEGEKAGPLTQGGGASSVSAGGKTFTEIDPATASVEVLESGPMRAVVLLRGTFKGANEIGAVAEIPQMTDEPDKKIDMSEAEKGKKAGPGLVYEARVYAYANSPRVFVDYTIINKIGSVAANKIDLEDLHLTLQLPGAKEDIAKGVFPLVEGFKEAKFPWELAIRSDSPDKLVWVHDNLEDMDADSPRKKQANHIGWLGCGKDGLGLAVGIRDFWQMFPASIWLGSLNKGNRLTIGLRDAGPLKPQELFIGQARTHRITLFFHDGKARAEALNAIFASTNVPLMPVAEPAWYCQKTQAWGPITSADADYGQYADVARHYDKILSESMDKIVRNVEVGLTAKARGIEVTQDGYGWMNWGDSFFRIGVEGPMFKEPHKNLSWNGNYYDYGMAMVYQWARTGEWRYLDHGLRAGAYTADVFNNHWWPEPERIGACHYCPPRYHAAIDNGTPYVSEQFNHAKVQSIVMRWQMLGDWWARQCMLETFHHAESMRGSENAAWRQCRGNGHLLHMLWADYEATGNKACIDRADTLLGLGVAFIKKNTEFDKAASQRFMVGIALEGMIQSQWLHPNKDVADTVKFVADYAVDEQKLKGYTSNMAMAYGWLWQQTGEEKYLKTLVRLINATGPVEHAKYFGQSFRSTPYAIGVLQEAAGKK